MTITQPRRTRRTHPEAFKQSLFPGPLGGHQNGIEDPFQGTKSRETG